jgi:hypothetical protein
MNLLYFLSDKLRFIEQLYSRAVAPFITIKRQIEEGEPPYDIYPPDFNPEDGEPAFTSEWIEADESQNVIGYACLGLVQSVLFEYLREYLQEKCCSLPSGKGALLHRYKVFFMDHFGIDWETGPVAFETLEDVALARNHIQHETRITSKFASQTADYRRRLPNSLFGGRFREIRVTEGGLKAAIGAVEEFCSFLDQQS